MPNSLLASSSLWNMPISHNLDVNHCFAVSICTLLQRMNKPRTSCQYFAMQEVSVMCIIQDVWHVFLRHEFQRRQYKYWSSFQVKCEDYKVCLWQESESLPSELWHERKSSPVAARDQSIYSYATWCMGLGLALWLHEKCYVVSHMNCEIMFLSLFSAW